MTKLEALAKDCIENHTHRLIDRPSKQDIYTREESIYISGYKECERQNKNKIIELEQKLEQTEKDLTDYQFNYPKIKDLEKENAELKAQLQKKINTTTVSDYPYSALKLEEAKEIIKFLINPQLLDKPQYYEWRLKAEQFLKE